MKSVYLDAESDFKFSHNEGDKVVYQVALRFVDVFGRTRRHFSYFTTEPNQALTHHVSFTALSHVDLKVGLIVKITDLVLTVATHRGEICLPNLHDHIFTLGEVVGVLEHMDMQNEIPSLGMIIIPCGIDISLDLLRLQAVNADVLDESGKVVFRLGADPLIKRVSYVARMAA